MLELARAARSAEKLFDTLRRELPSTLEAIRLTGMEISDLTDDVSDGVKGAGQVVKRVDQGLEGARRQAQKVQVTTRSVFAGVKAAWKSFTRTPTNTRRSSGRLSSSSKGLIDSSRAEVTLNRSTDKTKDFEKHYGREDFATESLYQEEELNLEMTPEVSSRNVELDTPTTEFSPTEQS